MAKSKIATAYVQVVPTTQGIRSQLTDEFGGHGDAAGGSFGASLVGKLKGIIATAGLGAMLGKALTEGGNLQQSMGGVETLFGDSAQKVIDNARKAYTTAGMSSNEYMETVTSFSASLLQSLAGDTAAAADIADMALIDMADNSNKFGTDMEAIQNAYQGFAKSNYTMLDNLKLGYGGTKSEMERLLADAQKISGVEYDISNLSDVYAAIHVIQEDLGVTGATAAEASTTFSGSMASMKAATTDLLANLTTGGDVAAAMSNLGGTVYNFVFLNLLPMVGNIVTGIGRAIIETDWLQVAMDTVNAIYTGLKTSADKIFGTEAGNLLVSAVQNIQDNLPQFLEQGKALVFNLIDGVTNKLPDLLLQGGEMVWNLISGALEKLPELAASAGTLMGEFATKIINSLPDLLAKGGEMVAMMIKGIGNVLPKLIESAGKLAKGFCDKLAETDWSHIGNDIVNGIIKGLSAMGTALWEAAKKIYNSFAGAVKDFFGIASPSKKMRDEVGKMLPAGIAVGVTANLDPLEDAALDLGRATMGALHSSAVPAATAGRQNNVTIHVYASEGQDVEELADELMRRMQYAVESREAVLA